MTRRIEPCGVWDGGRVCAAPAQMCQIDLDCCSGRCLQSSSCCLPEGVTHSDNAAACCDGDFDGDGICGLATCAPSGTWVDDVSDCCSGQYGPGGYCL